MRLVGVRPNRDLPRSRRATQRHGAGWLSIGTIVDRQDAHVAVKHNHWRDRHPKPRLGMLLVVFLAFTALLPQETLRVSLPCRRRVKTDMREPATRAIQAARPGQRHAVKHRLAASASEARN